MTFKHGVGERRRLSIKFDDRTGFELSNRDGHIVVRRRKAARGGEREQLRHR